MDVDFIGVPVDEHGRLTGANLRETLDKVGADGLFAVVATAGTTNFGIVDDLASVAEVCRELGVWFHVDGAYGGAGLAAPSIRHLYAGIEHADSFVGRPAQVVLRAVRLLRADLPRPAQWPRPRTPRRPATSTSSPTRPTGTPPTTRSA